MDIGELLAEAGLGRDAQAALLQPVAEGGNEGRGPGLPARVALSGIEAAEVGFDGVELGDATQALGRRVGSEVERDIANGDPDIASGGILVGIRCWAFPVAQDQRGEDGLTLLDIRRRQDKLTVLRQAPPGGELVRLDIEPCRHAVDCRAGAQGTRAAERWRAIRFTAFERRQIVAVRQELDAEYETANDTRSASQQPSRATEISSNPRT